MSVRAAVVLSALAAALGAYILVFEREPARASPADLAFPDLDRRAVREVLLEAGDGSGRVRLMHQGTRWHLLEPLERRADGIRVDDLLREASTAVVARTFGAGEMEGGAAAAGLGERQGLRLVLRTEEETRALRLGGEVLGGGRYALRDDAGEILVVRDAFAALPPTDVESWRERAIFGVSAFDLGSARVERRDGLPLAFARREDQWWIEEPLEDRADAEAVDRALGDLAALAAVAFVDDDPGDLARYGLDPPATTVVLRRRAGAEVGTLALGAPVAGAEGLRYARGTGPEASGEGVVSVRADALEALGRDPEGWRDRRVLAARPWDVSRAVLARGGASAEARRPEPGGEWTAPEGSPGVDPAAVEALLRDLDATRYLRFVPVPGSGEVARLTLDVDRPGDEKPATVVLRMFGIDGGEAVVAADDRRSAGTLPADWSERLRPEALLPSAPPAGGEP